MRREGTKGFQSLKGQLLCMNKGHAAFPFQATICYKQQDACLDFNHAYTSGVHALVHCGSTQGELFGVV